MSENTITIAGTEHTTIEAALKALGYTPVPEKWATKDDKAKWSEITKKRNEQEVKSARKLVNAFATEEETVASLSAELITALLRLAPTPGTKKSGGGGSKNPFMEKMKELFTKKGSVASEIDVFAITKYGRGEMKAKVRQNLKSATPADRMWIELDADKEQWKLLSIGEEQPEGWKGLAIDTPVEA